MVYLIVYNIIIFCSRAVYKKLKLQMKTTSVKSYVTQKQLLKIMFFQALVPITVQSLPATYLFIAANIVRFDSAFFSIPSTIFLTAIGGANAGSVLWIITSYRREVFRIFCFNIWKTSSVSHQSSTEIPRNSVFVTNNWINS